jgi:hypothetical protein
MMKWKEKRKEVMHPHEFLHCCQLVALSPKLCNPILFSPQLGDPYAISFLTNF